MGLAAAFGAGLALPVLATGFLLAAGCARAGAAFLPAGWARRSALSRPLAARVLPAGGRLLFDGRRCGYVVEGDDCFWFDTVYPFLGCDSSAGLAAQAGVVLTDTGEIPVDRSHQTTGGPGLYAVGRTADIEVHLVVAQVLSDARRLRQVRRLAATELDGHRVLHRVETQQAIAVAMDHRIRVNHLGVQARAGREDAVEDAAMRICPIHHRASFTRRVTGPAQQDDLGG